MKIKRDIYLDRLIRREKNGLIKIVTGVRRCGKSYLLFNLFHNYLLEKGLTDGYVQQRESAGGAFIPAFDLTGV